MQTVPDSTPQTEVKSQNPLPKDLEKVLSIDKLDPFSVAASKDGFSHLARYMAGESLQGTERLATVNAIIATQNIAERAQLQKDFEKLIEFDIFTTDLKEMAGKSESEVKEKAYRLADSWAETSHSPANTRRIVIEDRTETEIPPRREYDEISNGSITNGLDQESGSRLIELLSGKKFEDISNALKTGKSQDSTLKVTGYPGLTLVLDIPGGEPSVLVLEKRTVGRGEFEVSTSIALPHAKGLENIREAVLSAISKKLNESKPE